MDCADELKIASCRSDPLTYPFLLKHRLNSRRCATHRKSGPELLIKSIAAHQSERLD
jgi:hypothetical protein